MRPRPVLFVDCFAGVAGDMMLGALADLGEDLRGAIESALDGLDLAGYRLSFESEKRHGIAATRALVEVEAEDHPHRSHDDIARLIAGSSLEPATSERALAMFRALAEAEGKVHDRPAEEVCFHEVGAVDSIVDIVGVAAGLAHLDAEVCSAPVPLGRGLVRCAHGSLPLPAPATLELLEGIPVRGTEIDAELVTPTGATILRTQASSFGAIPAMRPTRIGWGAGARDHEDRPGLLRLVLGERDEAASPRCVVVEANIDDMTAELAAHALDRALEAGALDAWVTPITMKKGRPAMKLALLTRRDDLDRLSELLLAETTTIGLRYYEVGRRELPRRMVSVETPWGPVPVKISGAATGPRTVAPEYEACRQLAREHDVPLKVVLARAAAAALELADD